MSPEFYITPKGEQFVYENLTSVNVGEDEDLVVLTQLMDAPSSTRKDLGLELEMPGSHVAVVLTGLIDKGLVRSVVG